MKRSNFLPRSYQTEFTVKGWIIRIISLTIAFCSVIYYIHGTHQKNNERNKVDKLGIKYENHRDLKIPVFRSQR